MTLNTIPAAARQRACRFFRALHVSSTTATSRLTTTSSVSASRGALLSTIVHLWPYIWPSERRDLKLRVHGRHGAAGGGQVRDHRGSLHLQIRDRCAGRHGKRAGHGLAHLGGGRAHRHDHRLRRHAHADGGPAARPRRRLRQGGDVRGAAAGLPHLRAHARVVAALPSRAQDRRPDPRAGARAQRHRDHRAHGHPAARADHHRSDAGRRRAHGAFRLALRGGDRRSRRALPGLDLQRHRMAHRHPPQDERQRHRRQRQGDRIRF